MILAQFQSCQDACDYVDKHTTPANAGHLFIDGEEPNYRVYSTAPQLNAADYPAIKAHLPRLAHEIIGLIGIEAAFKLFNAKSGVSIAITQWRANPTKQQAELVNLIGRAAAERLSIAYQTQRILLIPTLKQAKTRIRNQRIHAEFDRLTQKPHTSARAAVTRLAHQFGLTERTIWHILKNN